MQDSDHAIASLTRAVADGDRDALGRLYDQWFHFAYAEARRATKRGEDFCLDVVQDAMMRVIRSMKPLPTEAALRAWLRAVVQSCAYDRLRREKRRAAREGRYARAKSNGSLHLDDDERDIVERLDWLRRELESLDEPAARLLLQRYRLGWTLKRIGEAVGLRTGAVDGRIGRLVNMLRHKARERFDES